MNAFRLSALLFIISISLSAQQPSPAPAPAATPAPAPTQSTPSPNRTAIPTDAAAATPRTAVDPTAAPINAPAVTPAPGQTPVEAIQAPPSAVSATPPVLQADSPVSGAPQATLQERQIQLQQLPVAVRQTIGRQAGTQPTQIQVNTSSGSPVYEVTMLRNGQPVTFQVNANGTLIAPGAPVVAPGTTTSSTLPVPNQTVAVTGDGRTRTVTFAQLPLAVQRAVMTQLGSVPPGEFTATSFNGVPVFEVPVIRDGLASSLLFAQDGTAVARPTTATATALPASTGVVTNGFYASLPPLVARNLQIELKTAEIQSVDKRKMDVYTARFDKDGKKNELRLLEDGTMVGTKPKGSSESSFTEPLTAERTITFDELPLPVQRALQDRTGLSLVDNIRVGQAFNRTVYQASYQKDNKQTEIRIGADGTLMGMREKAAVAMAEPSTTTVRLLDAPARVREGFNQKAPSVGIDTLEKSSMDIYRIAFKREGKVNDLQIAADGTIIRIDSPAVASSVQVSDLPEPVQKALRNYAANGAVTRVERATAEGQTIYRASWAQNGRSRDVAFTEAGAVFTEPSGAQAGPSAEPSRLTFAELPEAVRNSLKDQATAETVSQVTRSRVDGRTVFHVTTSKDGATRVIQVGEDGQLIR